MGCNNAVTKLLQTTLEEITFLIHFTKVRISIQIQYVWVYQLYNVM